jgi:hypothetical protein
MIFGDCDEQIFNRYRTCVELVAKEFCNRVVQTTANLAYWGQSGSVVNSIATVFAILVKQYALHQTASSARWLFGEGLLAPGIEGRAMLRLAAPGTACTTRSSGKIRSRPICATMARQSQITAASTSTQGSWIGVPPDCRGDRWVRLGKGRTDLVRGALRRMGDRWRLARQLRGRAESVNEGPAVSGACTDSSSGLMRWCLGPSIACAAKVRNCQDHPCDIASDAQSPPIVGIR